MGLFDQVRLLDALDVALVSTLIYAVYSLFSRTRTARMLIGLAAIGVVYLLARQLELRLTLTILQAFFAVIIIALIVIFQDEMRRLFERIGNQRWFGRPGNWKKGAISSVERRIQTLVDTIADLTGQRIGALIVIEGTNDVASMLSGGIVLNGQLSESIIKSIFDPHSQGHDGAIVISGDQISRFACHLPLSAETTKISDFGTRHAAGLGITERTDALCIIISEERGSVAVAKAGDIAVLGNPVELSGTLREFYESTERKTAVGWTRALLTRNLIPKFISVCLAIVLWILVVLLPSGD
ncbi:MAG: diadenylate cyclase [bacterium]